MGVLAPLCPVPWILTLCWIFFTNASIPSEGCVQSTPHVTLPAEMRQEIAHVTLPAEMHQEIVGMLDDCPETLRRLNMTSWALNAHARRFQFQSTRVFSLDCMMQLFGLLLSPHCTIPHHIASLTIEVGPSVFGRRIQYGSSMVQIALGTILDHFQVQHLVSLNLRWLVSRHLVWSYLHDYQHIRKFVLHGTYPTLSELPRALYHMRSLESLAINASFVDESDSLHLLASFSVDYAFLSPNLREISMSPASLILMRWMCSLEHRPESLHLVRIRVDDIGHHSLYFRYISMFLEMYGSRMAHLYVSFDEAWELYDGESSSCYLQPT